MKRVKIYTDGACQGNPGPGGFGAVMNYNGYYKELSGGFRLTTNNRMELYAVIAALEALKDSCGVTVVSDSRYIVDAVSKGWLFRWKAYGWRKSGGKGSVMNPDLWDRLLTVLQRHDTEFQWVKGHSGNEGNERADALASSAIGTAELEPDEGYESPVDYVKAHRLI